MQLEYILQTKGLIIGYDHDNQWLYVDWRGEHTRESSWAACQQMLEVMQQWHCEKILNDNSSITHQTAELSERSFGWLEQMRLAGLRYMAWVYPRNFPARKPSEESLQLIRRPLVATFDDVASACLWLRRQQNTLR